MHLVFAPDLVEEAVLLAEGSMRTADRLEFRRDRNRLYDIDDADHRDEAFARLHLRWFERLGLLQRVGTLIGALPHVAGTLTDARVLRAILRREEGADLVDRLAPPGAPPVPLLAIRLRPSTLLDADGLQALLRRELLHVEDMLDPAFAYERSLPASDLGPLGDNLVQQRYRVLWDVTVDGRLARAGLADGATRVARWREFERAFPMLEARAAAEFDAWFACERPTHPGLAAFAHTPIAAHGV